jgi:hypothetical protein
VEIDIVSFGEIEGIEEYEKSEIPAEIIDSVFNFIVPPQVEVIYMP